MNSNSVRLKGHLGASPEIRLTQKNDKMMQLKVATNDSFKTADGGWNQKTHWHHVQVFNQRLILQIEDRLSSGDFVQVEGALEYLPRETPLGETFKKAVIVVRRWGVIERLEPRGVNEGSDTTNIPGDIK